VEALKTARFIGALHGRGSEEWCEIYGPIFNATSLDIRTPTRERKNDGVAKPLRIDMQLVASFSRPSNSSARRARTGFLIGEARSVRHNVLDLLHLKRRGLSLRLRRTEGSEPQLRRAGREAV
jgi:hypothetical protein